MDLTAMNQNQLFLKVNSIFTYIGKLPSKKFTPLKKKKAMLEHKEVCFFNGRASKKKLNILKVKTSRNCEMFIPYVKKKTSIKGYNKEKVNKNTDF